jgi:hypothetical protein
MTTKAKKTENAFSRRANYPFAIKYCGMDEAY